MDYNLFFGIHIPLENAVLENLNIFSSKKNVRSNFLSHISMQKVYGVKHDGNIFTKINL